MNDLEKFKQLFDEIGVEYTVSNSQISINSKNIIEYKSAWGKALDISFSEEGKFLGFEPWGE
jgi:hypothetical protein